MVNTEKPFSKGAKTDSLTCQFLRVLQCDIDIGGM